MSSAVTYILNMTGSEFNQAIGPLDRASESELAEQAGNGVLWEGCLPDTSVELSIDLSGVVTPIWLATRYSAFQHDEKVREDVKDWEKKLLEKIEPTEALRVDEFLLEQMEIKIGADWVRESDAFKVVKNWLKENEKEGWDMI